MSPSATPQKKPTPSHPWTSLKAVEVGDELFDDVRDKVAIPLNLLANIGTTQSNIYLPKLNHQTGAIEFIKILPAQVPIPPRLVATIVKLGLEEVYMPGPRLGNLVRAAQEKTKSVIQDHRVTSRAKAKLIHDNAKLLATMALKEKKIEESMESAATYVETVCDFVRKVPEAMGDLAQMLTLDYSLYTHSVNVSLFALCFGEFIKLPAADVKALGMGAMYHDVGKTRISANVLKKPGPLSSDEWELMRQHSSYGFDILVKHPSFPKESLITVLHHHENMDGSGYPAGLSENDLPITSRISKILDCYDAITSTRCYKHGVTGYEAIRTMYNEMLPQLSTDLLTQFVKFLGSLGRKAGRKGTPDVLPLALGREED
jgi:HD-GYP domain-containing protein (c-di-GMP phosphodiesterase class II)